MDRQYRLYVYNTSQRESTIITTPATTRGSLIQPFFSERFRQLPAISFLELKENCSSKSFEGPGSSVAPNPGQGNYLAAMVGGNDQMP